MAGWPCLVVISFIHALFFLLPCEWGMPPPCPVMSSAQWCGMCICWVSAAVVCCISILNTDGVACLYTWQVHSLGISPAPLLHSSLYFPLFLSISVCHSAFHPVSCTCCLCLHWSALLSVRLCASLSMWVYAVQMLILGPADKALTR